MAQVIEKQPAESKLYQWNYAEELESGETITSVNSITDENLGKVSGSSDITIGPETIITPSVQIRISGGTDHENYKVTMLVTTSLSNILELDAVLHVRDI